MTDLVTFGETMLRLSPLGEEPLQMADGFDCRTGGAESNVAVGGQRLGAEATWISKLPDSELGHKVVNELHEYGIDTEVVWSDEGRQGVYFFEEGNDPLAANVIYDRADAAVTTATVDELATQRVRDADTFYTSGITPALSETLFDTVGDLLQLAEDAGTRTAFDVNYRSKLWPPRAAKDALTDLFPAIDVLVVAERDAENVLALDGAAEDMARALVDDYEFETVVVTRGEEGSLALHEGAVYEQGVFESETVDPIGTGDAFVGAFLARRIAGDTIETSLEYGAAAAAVKRTLPGDMLSAPGAAIEAVVERGGQGISR
jgi:2-dehydro-3-deoxygluconokinase